MNANPSKTKKISRILYILGIAMLVSGMMLTYISKPATAVPNSDLQLNLSHIACVDGQVEIHFVLLNVPDGITPGILTYTYGTISPSKDSGNVWHYTDLQPSGTYNITEASVEVNGVTVYLHNPGAYAGTYNCAPASTSTPTTLPTSTPDLTPTPTVTVTVTPSPTVTSTSIPFEELSFGYICSIEGTSWYVNNPNPFDVTFSYSINGNPPVDFTIPASTSNLPFTIVGPEAGSLTASLSFSGSLHEYSVTKETACEVNKEPQDLLLSYVCNVQSMDWKVINPNNFDVEFSYVVDPVTESVSLLNVGGTAIAPAGGTPFTFYVSSTANHVLQITYNLGGEATRTESITNGSDFCKIETVDTPVPTLKAPPAASSSLLIPVTGADLSNQFQGGVKPGTQKTVFSLGLGFLGLGLVFNGLSKRR